MSSDSARHLEYGEKNTKRKGTYAEEAHVPVPQSSPAVLVREERMMLLLHIF